jgi:hypothetical protein
VGEGESGRGGGIHFPFSILNLSFVIGKNWTDRFSSMTNDKFKMENGK